MLSYSELYTIHQTLAQSLRHSMTPYQRTQAEKALAIINREIAPMTEAMQPFAADCAKYGSD